MAHAEAGDIAEGAEQVLVEDPVQLAVPMSVHLFAVLGVVCFFAFRRPRTKLGRWRYGLLAVLLWSYVACTPGIANAFINDLEARHRKSEPQPAEGPPVIIVLSSGQFVGNGAGWQAKLDQAGWERTYAGIQLWRRLGGHLVFVGGPAPDGTTSQADAMAMIACASGVPTSSVHVESQSRNTYENLINARQLAAGLGTRVWLVTSALHMPRAMAIAERLGWSVEPYPCDFRGIRLQHWYAWLPNAGGAAMASDFLHEWIGLAWYRMRGYAA